MCIFWADCTKSISIPNEKAPAIGRGFSAAPGTPAVSKTRTVSLSSPRLARTRLFSGALPTMSSCFPGRGEIPRLRRASHAAAPSKTRTGFVPALSLARTRLVPGASPRMAPVFPGRGEILPPVPCGREETRRAKAPAHPQRTETPEKLELCSFGFSGRTCGGQFAHRVCACAQSRTHAAGSGGKPTLSFCFPGQGKAWLLFPSAEQKPEPNFHEYVKRGAKRSPTHRNARKAGALLLWLFGRTCGGQFAHRVSFFSASRTHAAGSGCKPNAGLLFSRAGRNPTSCSLRPGGNPPGKSPGASPTHRNARKAGALLLWLFGRTCGGQFAHRVSFFPASRTHAAGSGGKPTHGSCFPGRGEILPPVPCGREETRRAKAPAHPQRTETLEKAELCSLVFSSVSLISRRIAARRAVKPASSEKKGVSSLRAQASPFAQKRLKS